MELFDTFPDIEELDAASKFLHTSSLETGTSESFIPSLETCTACLTRDPTLHAKLKIAHETRDIEGIKWFRVYLKRNSWRYKCSPRINERIRRIETSGKIVQVARGEVTETIWTSRKESSDPTLTSHIQSLQIPLGSSVDLPLVVLHNLGSFQHDPTLRKRLERIFSPSHHTFFVNTSGSGKTRLLFEGLCLRWGFYLTCAIDTFELGAGDLPAVINDVELNKDWSTILPTASKANYTSSLQNNIRLVYRSTCEALLARLMIFKIYLETCSRDGFCHGHRQRWLESQILIDQIASSFDAFAMIKNDLSASDLSTSFLDEAIKNTLEDIQDIWEMSPGEFLYVVLDEANVAARKHCFAFRDEYGNYPVLKEILRTLRKQLGHLPVRFVVAGTIIPPEDFQSGVGEWDDFHWCSDTGSFDDPEVHRHYVSQFLTPELKASVTGQALMDRMWQWLQGRHRYTASFLAVLLANNLESPHTLLGEYIECITQYMPYDNHKYSHQEKYISNKWYSSLGANGLWREGVSVIEMHRAVITFLTTSQGSADCSSQDRALVSEDYGRFLDTGCTHTALDEPLTMIYGAGWFKRKETERDYTVSRFEAFHYDYGIEVRPMHFSLALALSLASFFDGLSELSDAFILFGLPQPLLKAKAKLVTFTKVDGNLQVNNAHLSADAPVQLVFLATTSEDALSWFRHERDEPFCVLVSSPGSGVTLVFCLQLSDGQSFWVSVRVSSTFLVRGSPDFAQDIEDIDPNESFRDQPEILKALEQLPEQCPDVGPLGMLRVSGSFWVKKATKKSLLARLPAAILNIKSLDEAGKMVSQDMLMRRFSRIIAQRKRQSLLLPTPTPSTSSNYNAGLERSSKKRGRTMTVVAAKVSNFPVGSIPSSKKRTSKRISDAATNNAAEGSRSPRTSTRISSLRSNNTRNRTATSGRTMASKRTTDDAATEPSGSKTLTRTETTMLSLATTGSKIAKSGKSSRNNPAPPPTSSTSRYSLRDRSKLSSPKK